MQVRRLKKTQYYQGKLAFYFFVRDQEAMGSSPVTPTKRKNRRRLSAVFYCLLNNFCKVLGMF